jgi:hypothetical protein
MTLTEQLRMHRFDPRKVQELLHSQSYAIHFMDPDFLGQILSEKLPADTLRFLLQAKIPKKGSYLMYIRMCEVNRWFHLIPVLNEFHVPPQWQKSS